MEIRLAPTVVASVALLATLLGGVQPPPAEAREPGDPDRVPAEVLFREAPSGEHRQTAADPEPTHLPMPPPASGLLAPGRVVLQTGDRVETLLGARLVLKQADALRPDGTRGPAWYWFNTRAGSTFHLDVCDPAGVPTVRQVSRKRFFERVRSTREREVTFTYDAPANAGRFEVRTLWRGRGPEPLACPWEPGLHVPAYVESAGEAGTGVHEESYDDDGSEVTVHEGGRLVLSTLGDDGEIWRVFDTGPGSRFFLATCLRSGEQVAREVTRRRFLERASSTQERSVTFTYDAERGAGEFRLGTYVEYSDCPPCGECRW